jgi:hypothetical protein
MVRLQRQVSDAQCNYFLKFLKPLSEQFGFWLVYEIDDVITYDEIPPYNMGKKAYNNEQFFQNVKAMLDASDIITVTTDKLKEFYVNRYNINEKKFMVIPNYLPRWWVGEAYNIDARVKSYKKHRKKPRIIFPMSSSHFDLLNNNNQEDDFTEMCDFVRVNHKKYEFNIIGHKPKLIEDLISDGNVKVIPGSDLLNYPRELVMRDFNAIIAPLRNNTFNKCKSAIKLHEGWALGLPVIAQNIDCYNEHTDMLFNDNNELQNQLDNLFCTQSKYRNIIKENRNKIDFGYDKHPNGLWIEKNIQIWHELFTMPQRTMTLDYSMVNLSKNNTINVEF